MEKVVAVVLAHNEEDSIKKTMKILNKHKKKGLIHQVVVVNDGSTDKTAKISEKLGAKVVSHKQSLGKRGGFVSGAFAARNAGASTMLLFDADLVKLPRDTVKEMVSRIKGGKQMVVARQHEMTEYSKKRFRKDYRKVGSSASNAQRAFSIKGLEPLFKHNKKWGQLLNAWEPSFTQYHPSKEIFSSNKWGLEAALDTLFPKNKKVYIENPVYTLPPYRKKNVDGRAQGRGRSIIYYAEDKRKDKAEALRELHKKILNVARRNDFKAAKNLRKRANKMTGKRK